MKLPATLLFIWAGAAAFGQAPRAVELFGTFGTFRAAGDEGSLGSGAAYGATATIPFASSWALDVQSLTSRVGDTPAFRLRRVLLSPALQYRRGTERALWFIAFGPGLQSDRSSGSYQAFDSPTSSRTVSFDDTSTGLTIHWRTGAIFQPTPRLLVRGEFFWVNRYALPSLGAAISLGIRLGR